jgi:hypothetical protein
MDTEELVNQAKLRFSHNSNKSYLEEKYLNKLILAEQNGLWKADTHTIAFLNSFDTETIIMVDSFNNPIKVNRQELLDKLKDIYTSVMQSYYEEYKVLEDNR